MVHENYGNKTNIFIDDESAPKKIKLFVLLSEWLLRHPQIQQSTKILYLWNTIPNLKDS